ncbi:hypothetical protein ACVILL_005210 [Bradyrhizobium sp. USDA 3364]
MSRECEVAPHLQLSSPGLDRAIQYAPASRLKHCRPWNAGSPAAEYGSLLSHAFAETNSEVVAPAEPTDNSPHTGNAVEYFTWLKAKLDSIEAMPSRRVSLFFRNAS